MEGGQQEDGGSPREHPADVGRAMDVDDQDHQLARVEPLVDLFAEGAVVIAVEEVVFHHLIGVDQLTELLLGAVVVIYTFLLPGAGCKRVVAETVFSISGWAVRKA